MKKKAPAPKASLAKQKAKLVVRINDEHWRGDALALRLVRRAANQALKSERARARETTILLTDNATLKGLNGDFRGRRKATNVLSFPSEEPGYLGDVAIAYGVVAREARAQKKTFAAHAAHLAVHGVLHLFGFDHEADSDAAVMETRERQILAALGIADPYRSTGKAA